MRTRARLLVAGAMTMAVWALATQGDAQRRVQAREAPVATTERITARQLETMRPAQIRALPDERVLVGADGGSATVGELRRRQRATRASVRNWLARQAEARDAYLAKRQAQIDESEAFERAVQQAAVERGLQALRERERPRRVLDRRRPLVRRGDG